MTSCSPYTGVETLEVLEVAENYNSFLTALILQHAAGNKILDFGAGIGTFARRLSAAGFDVTCVEPDHLLRERLVSQRLRALETVEFVADSTIDFIFAFNVLEHIEDDHSVLLQLHDKLKPSGRLLIYVPAFPVLWTALDTQVGHFRRYTAATLREAVQRAGFHVERIEYADSIGFATALLFRALRLPAERVSSKAVGFYDKWLFPFSRRMDAICHHWFGKNVFALCRTNLSH